MMGSGTGGAAGDLATLLVNIPRTLVGEAVSKLVGLGKTLLGGGGAGAGVQQWAGLVMTALGMLGLPGSDLPLVLHQMQTESGGNPRAINLTDINAQRGDPARGLIQGIGSTVRAH